MAGCVLLYVMSAGHGIAICYVMTGFLEQFHTWALAVAFGTNKRATRPSTLVYLCVSAAAE